LTGAFSSILPTDLKNLLVAGPMSKAVMIIDKTNRHLDFTAVESPSRFVLIVISQFSGTCSLLVFPSISFLFSA
jgi:hypothetical protein